MLLEGLVFFARVVAKRQACLDADLVDHVFDLGVYATHDAQADLARVFGQGVAQRVDVAGLQAGRGRHFVEGGARAHPEFAVARVGVELLGGARGAGLEEEQGSVGAVLVRLQHQDGVGFLFGAQA